MTCGVHIKYVTKRDKRTVLVKPATPKDDKKLTESVNLKNHGYKIITVPRKNPILYFIRSRVVLSKTTSYGYLYDSNPVLKFKCRN